LWRSVTLNIIRNLWHGQTWSPSSDRHSRCH
jgi:hypothetical protein